MISSSSSKIRIVANRLDFRSSLRVIKPLQDRLTTKKIRAITCKKNKTDFISETYHKNYIQDCVHLLILLSQGNYQMNTAQDAIAQTDWFYNMKVVFSTELWQLIQKNNSLSQKRNATAATKVAWFYGLFLFGIWIGLYSIVENHWR